MTTEKVRFNVNFRYPVTFTDGLLDPGNPVLADTLANVTQGNPIRILPVADGGLLQARPELPQELTTYLAGPRARRIECGPLLVIPGGEDAKNSPDAILAVAEACRTRHLCRKSVILVIGGGSVLDAVGLAASLIHRGMPLVRVPTTVLSQNDSGVGVKNGINLGHAKNFLGTFHPPAAVLNDARLLDTLPRRDRIAGLAEAFKVAAIKDVDFLDFLCESAWRAPHEPEILNAIIRHCARLHLEHIRTSGDPFEAGEARPLDFGHWAAHKLETLTGYALRHGEAVAVGIAIDLTYAAATGHVPPAEARRVIAAMARCGLPVTDAALDLHAPDGRRRILDGIEEFREHLGGELHVTLPSPFGRSVEISAFDGAILEQCLRAVADPTFPAGLRAAV